MMEPQSKDRTLIVSAKEAAEAITFDHDLFEWRPDEVVAALGSSLRTEGKRSLQLPSVENVLRELENQYTTTIESVGHCPGSKALKRAMDEVEYFHSEPIGEGKSSFFFPFGGVLLLFGFLLFVAYAMTH